ncbi:CHASE3 domain-containing protein [Algoriphagus sp. D3-2-R+10]|uniref:sensor histidine kinase n=1 Tax=Algoriphagus aurantiacus TaxID=3103948 RepID=UPI002B3C258C|nr:CHASE3 domain-containing protein [Algoriphagus sp. D3-2-R+10]MEB2774114.1 CHASE3 domain-containing protein [Algoriphagus sp. D3-2-R+10]
MKNEQNPSIRQVKIYSIVTLILIIVGSAISYWTAGRIEYYTNGVMHTSSVILRADELYSSILERETNIRGYVLTRNEEFLTHYQQSNVNAELLLAQLQGLTMDNGIQQNNIEELRGLINTRVRTFEKTIEYMKENGDLVGFLDPTKANNALIGYKMIKNVVLRIKEVEKTLSREKNQSLINNINALPFIVGLISVFSITIGLVTFFSIYQYNKSQLTANTEKALFQQKLKDQIKLLDNSNKELEQFAYVASHDLQEPLRKITAFSDLLNEQYADKLEGDGDLYLSRITAAAVRMRRLITDLLEYSRAGKIDSEKIKTIKLSEVISETLEDFEVAIQDKSAKITLGKLPKVKGSDTEYRQVFQNLISNSLKFSKPNENPEITITSDEASQELIGNYPSLDKSLNYHLIKVSDNGIGFEKEHTDKIFSIFQRLHAKKEYEGTGIGLSITRKIIEKNGGFIFAESIPGKGATFNIILPVAKI